MKERKHEPPVYEYPFFVVNSLLFQQMASQTNTLLRSEEEQKDDDAGALCVASVGGRQMATLDTNYAVKNMNLPSSLPSAGGDDGALSLNPKLKPCPFGFRLAGFSVASLEFSHSALNLEEKSTSDIKQLAQLTNSLDRRYVHRQFNCNITNPS